MKQQQQDISKLSLSQRLTHHSWKVRKESYDQLYYLLEEDPEQITIANNQYNIHKLIPYFNNLTDQHHATVLLQGLNCVQKLLSYQQLGSKHFLKLLNEGLEKFPLMTQLRKPILQKFMDILTQVQIQPRMLKDKLQLPQEKSVMYALQVIGILGIQSLKNDIKNLSEKHHKKCIRELAAEIYEQMIQKNQNINSNTPTTQPKIKKSQVTNSKNQKKIQPENAFNNKKMEIIQKLPYYEQLTKRQQQNYSSMLLQAIPSILNATSLNMDLGYFIRLMIEESNHVISANGVKILTQIMNENSKLIPSSYPLAFYLEKFKLHPTHPVNAILLDLTDSIMKAGRINDLLQAVYDGFNGNSIKANVKFGAILVLMRVIFSLYKADEQITKIFPNSKGIDIDFSFKNEKFDKLLVKVCDIISKDKKYKHYIQTIQAVTNSKYSFLKTSVKQTPKSLKQPSRNPSRLSNYSTKNVPSVSKPTTNKAPSVASTHKNEKTRQVSSMNTQIVLNQIIQICDKHQILPQRQKTKNSILLQNKLTFLKNDLLGGLANNKYELFFVSETLLALVRRYAPVAFEETSSILSSYIIEMLQQIASYRPKSISLSLRDSITIILTICLCQLVLKDQLQNLLSTLLENYSIKLIIEAISNIDGKVKKKNKKILLQWIQINITQQLIDERYHKIIQCIQEGKALSLWSIDHHGNVYKSSPSETPKKVFIGKQQKIQNQQDIVKKEANIVNSSKQSVVKTINKHRSATTMSIEPSQISNQQQINFKLNTSQYDRIQELSKQDISFPAHQISGIAHKDQDEQKWQYFLNKHKIIESTPRIMVNQLQKAGKKSYQLESSQKGQNTFISNQHHHQQSEQKRQTDFQQQEDFRQEMKRWRAQQIQVNNKKLPPIETEFKENFHETQEYRQHHQSSQKIIQKQIKSPTFKQISSKQFHHQSLQYTPQNHQNSQINQQIEHSAYHEQKSQQQQLKYELLNVEKLNYMLTCTANPYPHLRTLILIPFKSLTKKNQFLMELSSYLQSKQLKHPQPYNGVLLLVILLFTEIKTDKTLIGPLQQLYQYLASSCSTNDFLRTLLNLMHSVIEETLSTSRSFLLTILSKSICRLLPYVEDSVQMLRDVQQFYQIGEMVYFEMYEQQYQQIKTAIEGQCLNSLVHQALQKEGQNLKVIVEGWLQTKFKHKVKEYLQE